jgi:3-hydroxyisobutyrate dehydrogenase-like beta-hydroxyacid dehydrogenase
MVTDDKALASRERGRRAGLPKGSIHLAMGTHSVSVLREIGPLHDKAGQILVAAPVLGRPEAAAAGQVGIVAAGPKDAVAKLAPVLSLIGRRTFDAGTKPEGASAVKLANNMILGCAIEAMARFAGSEIRRRSRVVLRRMTDGLFAAPAYKVYGNIIAKSSTRRPGSRRRWASRTRIS